MEKKLKFVAYVFDEEMCKKIVLVHFKKNRLFLDWVFLHQMDIADHLTLMPLVIHAPRPFVLFSCKKPKMQSVFIQRFYIQRQIVMVRMSC